MNNDRERLIRCVQAVFPTLGETEVPHASTSRVGAWDSLATVTLAAVVEEEFECQFAPEEMEQLTSFEAILEHVAAAKQRAL